MNETHTVPEKVQEFAHKTDAVDIRTNTGGHSYRVEYDSGALISDGQIPDDYEFVLSFEPTPTIDLYEW